MRDEFVDDCASLTAAQEERIGQLRRLCAKVEKLALDSVPLFRTYQQLRVPLYLREPGCWLSAPHGEGKTTAMNYCAKRLAQELPNLPIFVITEHVLPANELKSFFVRALCESKHEYTDSTNVDKLRVRLARYWAELSDVSPIGCVVLLLDEGQAMRPVDEFLLKDLSNAIRLAGGSLHIFVFGESPSLDVLVSKRISAGQRNGANDRLFGGRQLKLFLYETKDDWESVFSRMDSQRYPELGNASIVEAFFGHMDTGAFEMKNEAACFFEELNALTKATASGSTNLRRVFVSIRHALLITALVSVHMGTRKISGISSSQWKESLRYGFSLST